MIYQNKMTQPNTWNVKFSNLQLNKLKYGIKNGTKVTLKLSSNAVGDSNKENAQVPMLPKAFSNNFSADIKLSKTWLPKIGQ